MAAAGGRVKASELKQRLEAAGVSTSGIVEKEELERLWAEVAARQGAAAPASSDDRREEGASDGCMAVPLVYQMDAAYAVVDGMKLLVDTGSAVSILTSAAAAGVGLPPGRKDCTLRSERDPTVALPSFGVASPSQQLPPQVDGILGFDCLRTFRAAEFDWAASTLRLHGPRSDWGGGAGAAAVAMPLAIQIVSAGELPFVPAAFGSVSDERRRCSVMALVDTGSPVTMVTPELAGRCQMAPTPSRDADILTTGVDGRPTRMQASLCDVVALGEPGSSRRVAHAEAVVYAGTCPMMAMAGWAGKEAALLGLDSLRSGVRAGQPRAAASGGAAAGRLVLDFERGQLFVCD